MKPKIKYLKIVKSLFLLYFKYTLSYGTELSEDSRMVVYVHYVSGVLVAGRLYVIFHCVSIMSEVTAFCYLAINKKMFD